MKRYIAMILSIGLLFSSCLRNDELNLPFYSFTPQEINDGLTLSYPSLENIDSIALKNIYEEVYSDDDLWSLRSLLVFRNGNLVSEAYLKDPNDITTRRLIWSCTKQFMGVLTGIAIDSGLIGSTNDRLDDLFTYELNNHPDKANIQIIDLLTMRSGIDYKNSGAGGQTDQLLRQKPDSLIDFVLSRPLNWTPGSNFNYNDGDPHLLAGIIQKKVGKPTDAWADDVLFSPLEITNINWVRYKDGKTFGGFGIETTPREMAKLALCVADSGRWKGQQVLSSDWINTMLTPQVDAENGFMFGYQWWLDVDRNIHFMWGHGGQFSFIVPEKDLLVIMTSIPNTQGDYEIDANEALPYVDRIVDACN